MIKKQLTSEQQRLHVSSNVLYFTSALYNIALQITLILIPLYAISLSFSPLQIAFLVSIPIVLLILIRIVGAFVTDIYGERIGMLASYASMIAAGIVFYFSNRYFELFIAQLLVSASRGLFWSTSQTYLSKLPFAKIKPSKIFGLFVSITAIGAMIGLALGGIFILIFGFKVSFLCVSCISAICLTVNFFMYDFSSEPNTKKAPDFMQTIVLFKVKPLLLAGICGYIAALPMSLISSFYPVYMNAVNIQESYIGILCSIRSIGTIFAGFIFARYLDKIKISVSFTYSLIIVGTTLVFTQMLSDAWALALVICATGIGAGMAQVLYQSITQKYSSVENRGAAMAFTTNFFSLSHLITPLIFGFIIQFFNLKASFLFFG